MSLKINFFPLHFILSLLLLISGVIIFGDTVYVYFSSNPYVNGLIIGLFVFCMLWILGVLSYYSRSTKVLNRLLAIVNPTTSGKNEEQRPKMRRQALYVASSITGTLIDSPVVSRVIAASIKSGRLDVSLSDATMVVDSVRENGERILGPSRFITSLFTMLGLFGTFIGLLQTIDGVGTALAALSDVNNIDILGFVKLLADPLNGMAIAFSASLFGLVGALFGNYGNYVASQKLLILLFKLKNFLTASSGIAIQDSSKIEAKDILVSLDESFNRLYTGIAERLDLVIEGIFSMSKAIVRTQERQERLMKVIIDSFASMEAMWSRLPQLAGYLKKIASMSEEVSSMMVENRREMMQYFDREVVSALQRINIGINDTADFTNEVAKTSREAVDIAYDQTGMIRTSVDIAGGILNQSQDLVNVSREVDGSVRNVIGGIDRLATINMDGNDIRNSMLSAFVDNMNVGMETRNLTEAILYKIPGSDYLSAFDQVIGELTASNNMQATLLERIPEGALSSLAASADIMAVVAERLEAIHSIATTMLYQFSQERQESTQAILSELTASNSLLDVSANQLTQIASLTNDILASVSKDTEIVLGDLSSSLTLNNEISQAALEELSRLNQLVDVINTGLENNTLNVTSLLEQVGDIRDISATVLNDIANSVSSLSDGNSPLGNIIAEVASIASEQVEISRNIQEATVANTEYMQVAAESNLQTADAMNNLSGVVTDVASSAMEAAQNLSGMSLSVAYDVSTVKEVFEEFSNRFNYILDTFQSNVDVIGNASEVAFNLSDSISNLNEMLYAVAPSLQELVQATMNASDSVTTVLDNLGEISLRTESVEDSINNLAEVLSGSLIDIQDNLGVMRQYTEGLSESIAHNIENIANQVNDSSDRDYQIIANLSELVEQFSDLKNNYADQMFSVADTLSQSLDNIQSSFDYISQNTNNMGALVDRVDELVSLNSEAVYQHNDNLEAIRDEMTNMSSLHQEFIEGFGGNIDTIANSVTEGIEEFVTKLDSLENIVVNQLNNLESMSNNLDGLNDYKEGFLADLNTQYSDMANMISDLVGSFNEAAEGIRVISDNITRQTDAIERQSYNIEDNVNVSANIIDELNRLTESSEILAETADGIRGVADNFLAIEDTLSKLDEVTRNQDSIFRNFSDNLSRDVELLANVVSRLSNMLEERDISNIQSDITKLANDVSYFVDRFEDVFSQNKGNTSNNNAFNNTSSELISVIDKLSDDVSEIRNTLLSSISNNVMNELRNVNLNQEDMLARLEDIITSLDNASNEGNSLSDNKNVLAALDDIRAEYLNGNMRLDVIANAIDSLITEMLNSRDITQSILDIVARLGNFKRD